MTTTIYRARRLLRGAPSWTAEHDGAVAVAGAVVLEAGPADEVERRHRGAETIDLGDVTILPGLIDAHVHLGFDGGADPVGRMTASTDPELLVRMLRSARELLSVGVTTVRDMGARSHLDGVVRDAIRRGDAAGPRVVAAGPPLTPTGGHCWFMGGETDGADAVRARVRDHRKRGADVIKVMATGGYMTPGFGPRNRQYTDDEIVAAVDEAHRLGMRVAAHAHGVAGIRQAVEAGVETLEHCSFLHPDGRVAWDEELGDLIVAAGAFVAPTVHLLHRAVTESRDGAFVPLVGQLHAAGAKVVASTDAGVDNVPHWAFTASLDVMQTLGMAPADVLTAATATAAEALGLDGVTGRIQPGLAADLIAVAGDPLTSLEALDELVLVVADGVSFTPDPVPRWRG